MKKIVLILAIFFNILNAKKLVILDPAIVEITYMLNGQDQILAISKSDSSEIWPQEQTKNLQSVGSYISPNLEKIVELKPDLVITSFHSLFVGEDLKKFNIKTISLQANSLDDVLLNIKKMGDILDKKDEAKKLIKQINEDLDKYKNLSNKSVISFFSTSPLVAFSEKTLPGDIFKKIGLVNLVNKGLIPTPIISNEFILAKNPDLIIVITNGKDAPSLDPIIKKTKAAKNNKILTLPASVVLRGGPRIIESIKLISDQIKD